MFEFSPSSVVSRSKPSCEPALYPPYCQPRHDHSEHCSISGAVDLTRELFKQLPKTIPHVCFKVLTRFPVRTSRLPSPGCGRPQGRVRPELLERAQGRRAKGERTLSLGQGSPSGRTPIFYPTVFHPAHATLYIGISFFQIPDLGSKLKLQRRCRIKGFTSASFSAHPSTQSTAIIAPAQLIISATPCSAPHDLLPHMADGLCHFFSSRSPWPCNNPFAPCDWRPDNIAGWW